MPISNSMGQQAIEAQALQTFLVSCPIAEIQ